MSDNHTRLLAFCGDVDSRNTRILQAHNVDHRIELRSSFQVTDAFSISKWSAGFVPLVEAAAVRPCLNCKGRGNIDVLGGKSACFDCDDGKVTDHLLLKLALAVAWACISEWRKIGCQCTKHKCAHCGPPIRALEACTAYLDDPTEGNLKRVVAAEELLVGMRVGWARRPCCIAWHGSEFQQSALTPGMHLSDTLFYADKLLGTDTVRFVLREKLKS